MSEHIQIEVSYLGITVCLVHTANFFKAKESLATQHLYLGRCSNLRAGNSLSTHTADLLHKILPLGKALFNSCVPDIRRPRAN